MNGVEPGFEDRLEDRLRGRVAEAAARYRAARVAAARRSEALDAALAEARAGGVGYGRLGRWAGMTRQAATTRVLKRVAGV